MSKIILSYPSHLRIETVQGCTRTCITCPCSCKKSNHKFMSIDTFFTYVLPNINNKVKRIEFSMHGEPLLNKYLPLFIKAIKEKEPKIQVSIISNGDLLNFQKVKLLFENGLNFIHVDIYNKKSKIKFMDTIRKNKSYFKENNIETIKFVKGGKNIWSYYGGKNKCILMSDESEGFNKIENHIIRNIHTWAGNLNLNEWKKFNIDINKFPLNKKCTEPMKCAPIDIYGNVTLCCADFNKSIIYGSLKYFSMYEIWNNETINKVRFLLSKGIRHAIPACYFCNRPSFRVGLWPAHKQYTDIQKIKKWMFNNSTYSNNLINLFKLKGINL